MIGDAFEFADGLARIIGWLTIIGGVLWLVQKILVENRTVREKREDELAQAKFEEYLRIQCPDKFTRYNRIRDRYWDNAVYQHTDQVHWHQIAQEADIPIIEILKTR